MKCSGSFFSVSNTTEKYNHFNTQKNSLEDLQMWRPISLMCCDFKIIVKALSIRLKQVLSHILNREQTCGVEGRLIFDNLYAFSDVIDHAKKNANPAYILSFDFHKAFDKVDHNFLIKTFRVRGKIHQLHPKIFRRM